MPTNLPLRGKAALRLKRWLLGAYGVSVVAGCSLLLVNGPQLRAAADAHEAQVAEEENKAFCSKLGAGPDTASYAQCAGELATIRARHLQRHVSQSIL